MDRSSGSSWNPNNTAISPISSYAGSTTTDEGPTRLGSAYSFQNSFVSPKPELPLFNIEKDGDPGIAWYMYYDFIVTKTKSYYQLQKGYLVTEKYPAQVHPKTV
jgi:hypothetical protein